MIERILSEILK